VEFRQYFSEHARDAIRHAADICRQFKHPEVGPQHLLFGVLCQRGSSSARLIRSLGLKGNELIFAVEAILNKLHGECETEPDFSADARSVLAAAYREAKLHRHALIHTVHLLIALVLEYPGLISSISSLLSLDSAELRATANLIALENSKDEDEAKSDEEDAAN